MSITFLTVGIVIIIGRSMALWEKRRWIIFLLGTVATVGNNLHSLSMFKLTSFQDYRFDNLWNADPHFEED